MGVVLTRAVGDCTPPRNANQLAMGVDAVVTIAAGVSLVVAVLFMAMMVDWDR